MLTLICKAVFERLGKARLQKSITDEVLGWLEPFFCNCTQALGESRLWSSICEKLRAQVKEFCLRSLHSNYVTKDGFIDGCYSTARHAQITRANIYIPLYSVKLELRKSFLARPIVNDWGCSKSSPIARKFVKNAPSYETDISSIASHLMTRLKYLVNTATTQRNRAKSAGLTSSVF